MRSLLIVLAMFPAISLGCSAAPGFPGNVSPGRRVVVELLDANFIRYEKNRLPMEDFIYEIRLMCRQAFDQGAAAPWIEVHVASGNTAVASTTFERFHRAMWDAGVGRIDPK